MSNEQWLDGKELEAWQLLTAMLFRLPPVLDGQLQRDEDLAFADYMVLALLSDLPNNAARMTFIADGLKLSQPRLTRVVTKLEKSGYVRRENSAEDRRVVNAVLTPQGQAKIEQAAPKHVAHVRENVIDRLTPTQIENLLDIVSTLMASEGTELSLGTACEGSLS